MTPGSVDSIPVTALSLFHDVISGRCNIDQQRDSNRGELTFIILGRYLRTHMKKKLLPQTHMKKEIMLRPGFKGSSSK